MRKQPKQPFRSVPVSQLNLLLFFFFFFNLLTLRITNYLGHMNNRKTESLSFQYKRATIEVSSSFNESCVKIIHYSQLIFFFFFFFFFFKDSILGTPYYFHGYWFVIRIFFSRVVMTFLLCSHLYVWSSWLLTFLSWWFCQHFQS